MMQQPICQENQLGNQQPLTQQMVLCPVKLVYDTQILVQPGDQIQPNQTIFINPQNPPPWIQNRMQNQVIYVQQVPNNYYQHQIDPNSVYVHNYPYQVQQQILPQNSHEQRPMQITNLAPNVMQGLPNVHNISHVQNVIQNERLVERHPHINNFGQMPQQIVPNRLAAPNLGINQVHNQMPQQTIELHRSGYVSNRPQLAVNANIRQQVVNSMPSIQQNVRQTFTPATNQQRPIQIHNNTANIQRIIQPPFTNPAQVQTVAKVLESISTVPSGSINKPTVVTTSVSNLRSLPNHAYRPIQPRPQYRHNVPNIGVLTQPIPQMQNIQSNNNNRAKDNRITNIPNKISTVNITNTDTKITTQGNRKRKSESPDEIQKKISIIGPSVSVIDTPKQTNVPLKNVTVSSGINIPHAERNALNQKTILQLTNCGAQIVKLVDNGQQTMPIENSVVKNEIIYPTNPNDKEKLIRNTVFPQARGRVLNDKELVPNNASAQEFKPLDKPEEELNKVKVLDVIKIELIEVKNENNNLGTLKDQQEELNKSGLKQENEISTREVQPKSEINCEQQILTHVLDGYVIQESNMAFPIRRPLKEKIIYENTKAENSEKDLKEDILDKTKPTAVKESKPTDLVQLPLQNLQLDNENSNAKKDIAKDGPFLKVQSATVKSWTVDNLAKYLTKYGWNETVSILQEHEIDGESLFLVSKTQLVHIGISEEHADIICEFVKH